MSRENQTSLGWVGIGVAGIAVRIACSQRQEALAGKIVLITGGSRGLGLELAREFYSRGCLVAVCARDESELEAASAEFESRGEHLNTYTCDLTNKDQVARMFEDIESAFGSIDILVNNAGVIQVGPLQNQALDDFQNAMAGNFWSAVHACLEIIPRMQRRGKGQIVNISSIGGRIAVPHLLPYCAAKFALTGFSEGLQQELAKDNIGVTTVFPGLMRTGSPRNVDVKGQHRKEYAWFILSDSIPGSSMNARRAARSIVDACAAGKARITVGLPAKLAVAMKAIAPEALSHLMAGINTMLPKPSEHQEIAKGFESESTLTENVLTQLTREAEVENNEI